MSRLAGRPRTAGRVVPIRTGELEEHIVADVAWAAGCYIDWTGRRGVRALGPGGELLVETARYWASRIRTDADGAAHIDGVIGPDEYHEAVDDNAFTNVMALWNLRRAAARRQERGRRPEPSERLRGLTSPTALVDGYDPDLGVYEEFAGFLEPRAARDRRYRAAAADRGRPATRTERVDGARW